MDNHEDHPPMQKTDPKTDDVLDNPLCKKADSVKTEWKKVAPKRIAKKRKHRKPRKLKRANRDKLGTHDNDVSSIIGKTPQPIFHLDVEEYIGQLGDYDMSEDEKAELLLALWDIMCRFVELGFGVYSDTSDSDERGKQVKFPRKPKPDMIDYDKK